MMSFSRLLVMLPVVATLGLAGCEERQGGLPSKHWVQVSPQTMALMSSKGMTRSDPVLLRSYKKESELEVWKKTSSGEYALLKTFPMCRWSGQLGPKAREGDRQAPEGFYHISPAQMNPNSSFHLSFNMGYPNAFDRAYGRSGSHLMVHGACSSRGCYSMTDEQIEEIYALVRDAHSGGQSSVQMQALPFRMTAENLAKHRANPHIGFWKNLKEGADHFEVTKKEPKVAVCNRQYVFNSANNDSLDASSPCPTLKVDEQIAAQVREKQQKDNQQIAELIAKGTPAIKVVYDDGDQHHSFKGTAFASASEERATTASVQRPLIAGVSRPEALLNGPKIVMLDDKGKALEAKPAPTLQTALIQQAVPSSEKIEKTVQPRTNVVDATVKDANLTTASLNNAPQNTSQEKPFYSRLLSPVSGLFGAQEQAKPESAQSEEVVAAQPSIAHPLPTPRPRGQTVSQKQLRDTPTTLNAPAQFR